MLQQQAPVAMVDRAVAAAGLTMQTVA